MGLKQGGYLVGEGTLNLAGVADRLDAFSFSVRTPILMDKNGKQMAAMDEHYSTICEKVTMCDEGRGYVVYDSGVERYIADLERLTADGDAFKADTLEELAAKMGIDVDNFMVTIETHNKHYHEQTNDEWGTEASTLVPIEKGPFYGFKYASYVMGTIAGLAVNTDLQIVREDGSAVENLYAIGELMYGNMFNTLYPMSGTALTICISGGQIAATHAVETMIQK
jgi:fumarate reductase flavoprotein subunit